MADSLADADEKTVAGDGKAAEAAGQRNMHRRIADSRVAGQPAFVLHSRVYMESSLVADIFTRDYGRVGLVAKGAKRPASKLRGVLQTFQPLSVSWTGKSELKTLTAAEWVGGMAPLDNSVLLYGFYLNELLIRLLAREDPCRNLFDHYIRALKRLGAGELPDNVLRIFELALLKEIGVAADLRTDSGSGGPVDPDNVYVVEPEGGPRPAGPEDTLPRISGRTLLAMAEEDYTDPQTRQQSKLLMRSLLAYHLDGVPLQTRKILVDLRRF